MRLKRLHANYSPGGMTASADSSYIIPVYAPQSIKQNRNRPRSVDFDDGSFALLNPGFEDLLSCLEIASHLQVRPVEGRHLGA